MTKRTIIRDPIKERKKAYTELENSGEAQKALWDALELLTANGVDIGPKACKLLDIRSDIKKRIPK